MSKNHPKNLPAWVDGEVSAAVAAEIAAHVERCSFCAERVADYREVNRLVAGLGVGPAPAVSFRAVVRDAKAAEREELHVVRWLKVMTAAAAVLLITSLGLIGYSTAGGSADLQREVAGTSEQQRDDAMAVVFTELWAEEEF